MTLDNIADKKADCGGASADTGKLGCQIEWDTPLHIIGMRKGFEMPADTTFNKSYIDQQILVGNFIPLIGAESFEDESSEDEITTNSRGVERINTPGLPKYMFGFEEGHEFYKEMSKLTSFKALDYIFGDGKGNWRVAKNPNGTYGGFSSGQSIAKMAKTKTLGGDPESKSFSIQLLDRLQWDQNSSFLLREQLDFSPEEIDGINGVKISFDAIPADGATTFDFSVVLAADGITPVEGLIADNFQYTVGATVTAIAVAENSAGKYTATVVAINAGEVLGLKTYNTTTKTAAILNEGVLYRGDLVDETAV